MHYPAAGSGVAIAIFIIAQSQRNYPLSVSEKKEHLPVPVSCQWYGSRHLPPDIRHENLSQMVFQPGNTKYVYFVAHFT
jgi:hypothetical protein